jgi:hypothetical protein
MVFSPEKAIADFKRKVKEIWNIPVKMYYLIINGVHESLVKAWKKITTVTVQIRGLGAGKPDRSDRHGSFDLAKPEAERARKSGTLTLFIEGEEIRCRTNQTILEILEARDMVVEDECLFTNEGTRIEMDEKLGTHFPPGASIELSWYWDPTNDEEEKSEEEDEGNHQEEFIMFTWNYKDIQTMGDPKKTLRAWAEERRYQWAVFRSYKNDKLDPDTTIEETPRLQGRISFCILSKDELEEDELWNTGDQQDIPEDEIEAMYAEATHIEEEEKDSFHSNDEDISVEENSNPTPDDADEKRIRDRDNVTTISSSNHPAEHSIQDQRNDDSSPLSRQSVKSKHPIVTLPELETHIQSIETHERNDNTTGIPTRDLDEETTDSGDLRRANSN